MRTKMTDWICPNDDTPLSEYSGEGLYQCPKCNKLVRPIPDVHPATGKKVPGGVWQRLTKLLATNKDDKK